MSDARARYKQGFQKFAEGQLDEAIELYRQAIDADPELAIAWNGLSMAYRSKGDLDQAIEAGLKLIEVEPDESLNYTNLSILYQNKGMIAEAEEQSALAMKLEMKGKSEG
ncbi:tetratricopeptide repeat protein [Myxococcota bacterium]|nr:tetratricopeptide repeat protein [Myxococcota bacterium]